ncbi:MAG: 1-deoxy-D-xylulose-5-phosphate synthase [Opitutae bacterium]|nr:1-deoxy-D-xylulose-5-phosphate synthase [Opitutae bacterium]
MSLLDGIENRGDLKGLDENQLEQLAHEIRARIIQVTSNNGGHVGPNLGVVELTLALHLAFDTAKDRLVFDVSHQGYVHKLLTGRNDERFDALRQTNGLSGFINREESEHDHYGAGHAGTCLSAALGMAVARDLNRTGEHVVAICGDAAFTCGITLEALNNAASTTKKLIVILNDNEWSIAKNVGALSKYFNELITNPAYLKIHEDLEAFLKKIPGGKSLIKLGSKAKQDTKDLFAPSSLFEKLGLRYIGPIDGHDIEQLTHHLEFAKTAKEPLVLHVLTKKGKGYEIAENHPERFHGAGPFDPETGHGKPAKSGAPMKYQDAFGKSIVKLARKDPRIVGITAAMPSGTGLSALKEVSESRFFDVGIAEEHAILFAAGMAVRGLRPVCAIYSTFLQRAYDPIIHDICLQNLPVLFCMDRAGLSPNDGPTHHGLFDLSYLRCVPNAVIMQPKDVNELQDMVATGLKMDGPCFIRYPRGAGDGKDLRPEPSILQTGRAEIAREGEDLVFWALGPMISEAKKLAERLEIEEGIKCGVVNARFIKPLDKGLLKRQIVEGSRIVTMEDHVLAGGFGSAVLEFIENEGLSAQVERIGWPDEFVDHGSSVADLRKQHGLDFESMLEQLRKFLQASQRSSGEYVSND